MLRPPLFPLRRQTKHIEMQLQLISVLSPEQSVHARDGAAARAVSRSPTICDCEQFSAERVQLGMGVPVHSCSLTRETQASLGRENILRKDRETLQGGLGLCMVHVPRPARYKDTKNSL